MMLGNAGNHPRLTGAADAELARIVDIDPGLVQHFENFLALGNEIFLAGARKFDPEAAHMTAGGIVFRREILDVNITRRTTYRGRFERFEHWVWPAAIKVRVLRR